MDSASNAIIVPDGLDQSNRSNMDFDAEGNADLYARAPEYNRAKADKYTTVLAFVNGSRGAAFAAKVGEWNALHPEATVSVKSVYTAKAKVAQEGISGLLGKYGKAAGKSVVPDDLFDRFKDYYLAEGAPSARQCWLRVLGWMQRQEPVGARRAVPDFPSPSAFVRRIEREVPEGAIYLARFGRDAWNRKYNTYIDRDYSDLAAGQAWVSDHAQIDVCVELSGGKRCFPWVTAWTDIKTQKWLGWIVRAEAPSSDPIFASFRRAALAWGLPKTVLLDNGKDFRCRDFAGGRSMHRLALDETKTTSTLSQLGITPRFARPYNAQSKPIERSFLRNKEMLSKFFIGYRGGDVTERPERLKDEIKAGQILPIAKFIELFNSFIIECVNRCPVWEGKVLQGRSPDQAWAEWFTVKREVSGAALKLFCMRTTRPATIGRNGVNDPDLGCLYWGDWMSGMQGRKVYLRRDVDDYAEAYAFDAVTDEYLDTCRTNVFRASFFAETPVQVEQFRRAIAAKKNHERSARAYANSTMIGAEDGLADLVAGIAALAGPTAEATPKIHEIPNTAMDQVARKMAENARDGDVDVAALSGDFVPRRKLAMFESDLEEAV